MAIKVQTEPGYCPKIPYASRYAAKQALARCRNVGREERRVYKCDECGKWHLTKKPVWND